MSGRLSVHPRRLAEALENSINFTREKKSNDRYDINDTIWVGWTGEVLNVRGRSSYSASIHTLTLDHAESTPWTVIIDVEDADALQKTLKGVEGSNAKDTRVTLTTIDADEVALHQGERYLGSFLQVEEEEPGEFDRVWGNLDYIGSLQGRRTPPTAPLAWTRIVLEKLLKVRVGDGHKAWDRFEVHWLGGATWSCRIVSEDGQSVFTGLLESTRDNLEDLS